MKNISIFHLKKFHFTEIKIAVYYIVPTLANVYSFLYSMHVRVYEYIYAYNILMFKKNNHRYVIKPPHEKICLRGFTAAEDGYKQA